jgi:F-type H+-transporting ATPase subunit b
MLAEILGEVVAEVVASPWAFVAEVVQFALLIGIAYVVMVGFGSRKGMVVNMLAERRQRIADRLERASGSDQRLEQAREQAARRLESARDEAASVLGRARSDARSTMRAARGGADAEADAIRAHAELVLEQEVAEMHVQTRDRLVAVVAQATRSLLNEGMTPSEQRGLIEGIVGAGLVQLEDSLVEQQAGGTPR